MAEAIEEIKQTYYLLLIVTKNNRGIARFYAGTQHSRGVLEAKMRCDIDLVEGYAVQQGFKKRGRGGVRRLYYINEWERYSRTMIYTVITGNLRNRYKKIMAVDAVNNLDYFDLKYWTGVLASRYHRMGVKGLLRPAHALRVLLGLDRR